MTRGQLIETPRCTHDKIKVEFDEDAAENMNENEVRKHYPRADAMCPDCGQRVIKYASMKHYIAGDW